VALRGDQALFEHTPKFDGHAINPGNVELSDREKEEALKKVSAATGRPIRIFDYVDRSIPMLLKMFENRLRGYRAIGYARDEAPLGFAPPARN
jgi:hypothetical protein